jgi:hypothetical protein
VNVIAITLAPSSRRAARLAAAAPVPDPLSNPISDETYAACLADLGYPPESLEAIGEHSIAAAMRALTPPRPRHLRAVDGAAR